MRLFGSITAVAAALLVLGGCANSRGGSIPYDVATFRPPDAPKAPAITAEYAVSTGDILAVAVFQADQLSKDYTVDAAGNIGLPLIGSVPVIGRTTGVIRQEIATRLGARYLRNPDVSVSVREAANRKITVDGAVRLPGVFPFTGELTLIQAVALARGTDDTANPRRVAVFRTIDGTRMAAAFDLTSIRRGKAKDPAIYAGDVVVVDGSAANATFKTLLQTLPVVSLFRPF